jgi:ATP-dependent RNA helicase DHX34
MKRRRGNCADKPISKSALSNDYSKEYKLPLKYDKRWRLNFIYESIKSKVSNYDAAGNQIKTNIDNKKLDEFELIIHLYFDFCQKEKFKKFKNIRSSQGNLPVFKYRQEILESVKNNQITIIAGDTGCGKSTQIPRYLIEADYDKIACTQPRRIACLSLAKRVSYETLNEYRTQVAHQVRFERTRTKHTKILFLTEGVLLRQIQTDPMLKQYNIIVVDEVHERHVFTDFLLGILKCLITKRSDLKVILMSATINIELFSKYFNNCVVIKIPGRTFKINVEYLPNNKSDLKSNKIDVTPYIKLMQLVDKKYSQEERGDMLIFLSGLSDMQSVYDAAKEYAIESKRWIVLLLHSSLSISEQDKVFDIPPQGKCCFCRYSTLN